MSAEHGREMEFHKASQRTDEGMRYALDSLEVSPMLVDGDWFAVTDPRLAVYRKDSPFGREMARYIGEALSPDKYGRMRVAIQNKDLDAVREILARWPETPPEGDGVAERS